MGLFFVELFDPVFLDHLNLYKCCNARKTPDPEIGGGGECLIDGG